MNDLISLYMRMKDVLEQSGGYEALNEEQQDLFNEATDALMKAKFEPEDIEQAEAAVSEFLDAMSEEHTASVLIRASDALDQAGQIKLANEIDAILRNMRRTKC